MQTKHYQACLFDLYGTLVDIHTDESKPVFWRKVADFYQARGANWEGPSLQERYCALCAGEETRLRASAPPEALVEPDLTRVFAGLYEEKEIPGSRALVQETARFFRNASTTHLRAYAGAKTLLQTLRERGIRVVLLSNAQACFTRPELDHLGLTDCFDRIFISSEVGRKKPDPAFFRAALDQLELRPEQCVMIGNDPVCDVAGALSVGLDAVYIHSALSPKKPLPDPDSRILPPPPESDRPRLIRIQPRMDLPALLRFFTL